MPRFCLAAVTSQADRNERAVGPDTNVNKNAKPKLPSIDVSDFACRDHPGSYGRHRSARI